MPHLNFPSKYLDALNKIIKEKIPDAEVWAFGSRVNGKSHESSDLDLVVHQKTATADALVMFKESVSNSNIPILIDILNWEKIPNAFKDEIQKKHVVIYTPH